MVKTKKQNNVITYTLMNIILFGMVVLLSNNYVFEVLNWLLNLLNIQYAKYIVAIVIYFMMVFIVKTFLIGSFIDPLKDAKEDGEYLLSSIIALVGYILLDKFLLSTKYVTFSLL